MKKQLNPQGAKPAKRTSENTRMEEKQKEPGNRMHPDLRPAVEADFEFVCTVTEAAMRGYIEQTWGPWDPSRQRDNARKSFSAGICQNISIQGQAAGILAVETHDTHLQLEKIFLLPEFQSKRIGTFLVKNLVARAASEGKPVRLRVLRVNPARRLYERLGFTVTDMTAERVYM
jgi:GNAT superfamily N-acetyltransferase